VLASSSIYAYIGSSFALWCAKLLLFFYISKKIKRIVTKICILLCKYSNSFSLLFLPSKSSAACSISPISSGKSAKTDTLYQSLLLFPAPLVQGDANALFFADEMEGFHTSILLAESDEEDA